jgi:hypothetical protein
MAGYHIDKKTERMIGKHSHSVSFLPCFFHVSSNNHYKAAEQVHLTHEGNEVSSHPTKM